MSPPHETGTPAINRLVKIIYLPDNGFVAACREALSRLGYPTLEPPPKNALSATTSPTNGMSFLTDRSFARARCHFHRYSALLDHVSDFH